jgi:hypothetical protein
LVVFTYVIVTFVILKIITAIVIKSIKEAQEQIRSEKKLAQQLYQESMKLFKHANFLTAFARKKANKNKKK